MKIFLLVMGMLAVIVRSPFAMEADTAVLASEESRKIVFEIYWSCLNVIEIAEKSLPETAEKEIEKLRNDFDILTGGSEIRHAIHNDYLLYNHLRTRSTFGVSFDQNYYEKRAQMSRMNYIYNYNKEEELRSSQRMVECNNWIYSHFNNIYFRCVEALKIAAQNYLNMCFKADLNPFSNDLFPIVSDDRLSDAHRKLEIAIEQIGEDTLEKIKSFYYSNNDEMAMEDAYVKFAQPYQDQFRILKEKY